MAGGLAGAQTVFNGSFELGTNPGSDFIEFTAPDSTSITGWTVASGTIDYIGGRWLAADGSRSLDLSGINNGTLTQSISGFLGGTTSRLSFYMAANPDSRPYRKKEHRLGRRGAERK